MNYKTEENAQSRVNSIFNFIDDAYLSEDYNMIDAIFKNIDLDKWDENELVGFLSVTFPCKNRFRNRPDFFTNVHKKFDKLLGEERAQRVLEGLK